MTHEIVELAEGWTGTEQTVERMAQLARDGMLSPVVVRAARDIVRFVPERDVAAEIRAVSRYVRRHLRYTREGVETLSTPEDMVRDINRSGRFVGDCDEASILWASLHRILGHRVRFAVISQRRDGVAGHVYGEVLSPSGKWIPDDTIARRFPLGWAVRRFTVKRTYNVEGHEMAGPLRILRWSNRAIVYNPPALEGLGIVPIIAAGITAAATAGSLIYQQKMQKKAEKKAKKSEKKAQAQFEAEQARIAEEEARIRAGAGPAGTAGNWTRYLPWLAVGGVGLVALAALARR